MDFVKFLGKKSKTSHLDRNSHIVDDIIQNHDQKTKVKKSKRTKILWAKQTSSAL
jgi:hypothetical protein